MERKGIKMMLMNKDSLVKAIEELIEKTIASEIANGNTGEWGKGAIAGMKSVIVLINEVEKVSKEK